MLRAMLLCILFMFITGCASSSDIEKSARIHAKARDYYESIGQPHAADEENKLVNKKRNEANELNSILVELFNLFSRN